MPCWEISRFTVEFRVASKEYLIKALQKLGLRHAVDPKRDIIYCDTFTINLETSELETTAYRAMSTESVVNRLKRAYSEVILEAAAKKNKWLLKKKAEQNKFELRRF